jgi:hypothetical protein
MIISFSEDVVLVSTRAKRIENAKQFLKDFEAEWKSSNEMWNAEQEKKKIKRRDDENDDVQFIVDTVNDSNLGLQVDEQVDGQADYTAFDLGDEDNFDQDEDDYFD